MTAKEIVNWIRTEALVLRKEEQKIFLEDIIIELDSMIDAVNDELEDENTGD